MYNLFEDEHLELEHKCSQLEEILHELRPQDRMLWDAYAKEGFSQTRLVKAIEEKTGAGSISRTSMQRDLYRIRSYLYNRLTGKAKRYTACVVIEFWTDGDTDQVMDHMDKIESDMVAMLSDYKNGTYKKTILK